MKCSCEVCYHMSSLCLPLNREFFSLKFYEYKNSFYWFFSSVKPKTAHCQICDHGIILLHMFILFGIFIFSSGDVFIMTGKRINHTIITYYKIQPFICWKFFKECLCLKNWCTSWRIPLTTPHIQLSNKMLFKVLWRNGQVWAMELMGTWHTVEDNQHHITKL